MVENMEKFLKIDSFITSMKNRCDKLPRALRKLKFLARVTIFEENCS